MENQVSNQVDKTRKYNLFARLFELLTFINKRKKDTRFPIIVWNVLLVYSLLVAIVLAFLFYFIDDPYFKLYSTDSLPSGMVYEYITKVGKSNWILILTGVIIIVLGFKSADQFKGQLHAVWHKVFFTTWFIFYSVAVSGLLTIFLKFCFGRSRPNSVMGESAFEFSPFIGGYNFASFPSGHSTTIGALAMILILFFPRYKLAFIMFAIITASTRFIIGAHFPTDVAMGLFIGAVFTWIYARSMARHRILFGFDKKGALKLRQEGKGHYHKISTMFIK